MEKTFNTGDIVYASHRSLSDLISKIFLTVGFLPIWYISP